MQQLTSAWLKWIQTSTAAWKMMKINLRLMMRTSLWISVRRETHPELSRRMKRWERSLKKLQRMTTSNDAGESLGRSRMIERLLL